MLPTDDKERKAIPMFHGLLAYFPDALAAVAYHSYVNNEKHNPGQPLHWSRHKSTDHDDTVIRHMTDLTHQTERKDRILSRKAVAWRALAALQLEIEAEEEANAEAVRQEQERIPLRSDAGPQSDPLDRVHEEMDSIVHPDATRGKHGDGQLRYECKVCNNEFSTPQGLAAHRMGRRECRPGDIRHVDVV
jgi:hypothetical protein